MLGDVRLPIAILEKCGIVFKSAADLKKRVRMALDCVGREWDLTKPIHGPIAGGLGNQPTSVELRMTVADVGVFVVESQIVALKERNILLAIGSDSADVEYTSGRPVANVHCDQNGRGAGKGTCDRMRSDDVGLGGSLSFGWHRYGESGVPPGGPRCLWDYRTPRYRRHC